MKISATSKKAIAALAAVGLLFCAPQMSQAQEIAAEPAFSFSPTRPKLVVLLHGVTPKPTEQPSQYIGASGHARYYWGYEFIKGLQGKLHETHMRVVTPKIGGQFRMTTIDRTGWQPSTTDTNGLDLAPIFFPIAGFTNVTPQNQLDQNFIKGYISWMTGSAENPMVMINTRNGANHLMPQTAETIEEIYHSYKNAFGSLPVDRQPQIYLVGHSFGGVIARAILANPTGADLYGNKLNIYQRQMADFLRQRVVAVQTIAAPHEGTLIGDPASDVADFISTYGYGPVNGIVQLLDFFATQDLTPEQTEAYTKEIIKGALDEVSGKRDCLEDLRRMPEYNAGILHPNTARRSANGALVPIYTGAGRNPGGTYFDDSRSVFYLGGSTWNPVSAFDLIRGTRHSKNASALKLIESVLHNEGYGRLGKKPWGNAEFALGDKVASPMAGVGPTTARPLSQGFFPSNKVIFGAASELFDGKPYRTGIGDGEWDNDGFLAWDSAHGVHLSATNYFRAFDPLKYGSMLPWDVDNHGSIMFNPAVGAWIHNEVIRAAGPTVGLPGLRRSVWSSTDVPVQPNVNLKVELMRIEDAKNDLDLATGADFSVTTRIGDVESTKHLPNDTSIFVPTSTTIPTWTHLNFRGSIIPIRIRVVERDNPNYGDPNDQCVASPTPGQTSLYVYFDTRTNRIIGDVQGDAGAIIDVKPVWWGVSNRVNMKIRITRTN